MSLEAKLEKVLQRFHTVQETLGTGVVNDVQEFANLSKEFAELSPVAAQIIEWQRKRQELADATAMLEQPDLDADLKALAQEEAQTLKETVATLEHEVKILLLPKDEADDRNVIVEIRAGTGGEEAALFAADLLRMYQRYADTKGWSYELFDVNDTGIGGIKEASLNIRGKGAYARLKFESGVHRVQRVPATEASGRIHTSAATVAVLPEAEDVDIQIADQDLRIDVFRSSGPGGQSVNTTDSAVRITHLPTGIVVQQQDEKSQHKNKAKALKILRSRLYEAERQRQMDARAEARKSQIGSGDRSERIRTYNFSQGRVSDHRINLTIYKLAQVLEGAALDEIINPLIADDQATRLAEES